MIQVRLGNSASIETVFDTMGRQLRSGKSAGSLTIPLHHLARGWYVVMVQRGDERFTRKIMLE